MPDWSALRAGMVEGQLRRRGILDARVLEAMGAVPREAFVLASRAGEAYWDGPLDIGCSQTISQPYIVALMAQSLELRGTEKVLEIGAGSGYSAAVLGLLAARVVALELLPRLCAAAKASLAKTGLGRNVQLIRGDGSLGYPAEAPFDAISVAAGAPEVPQELVGQLTEGGRLVIPVGSLEEQDLLVVEKRGDTTFTRQVSGCRFVPLRGEAGWR